MKEKQLKQSTQVQTKVLTTTRPEPAPYDLLEPIEEKVIRMHYGLSESEEKTLDYAVGASEDSKMRVTLMEAGNISELDAEVPIAANSNREVLREFVKGLEL